MCKNNHKINIIGIGIDIVKKKRIEKLHLKYKEKFIKKILNKYEIKNLKKSKNEIKFLCKVFSSKEAIIKSLGMGFRFCTSFLNINIFRNKINKPKIFYKFKHMLIKKNIRTKISVSHEKTITITIGIVIEKY